MRIGDEISPVSLTVKGTIALNPEISQSALVFVDLFFLHSKSIKNQANNNQILTANLLFAGNGGVTSYDGTSFHGMLPVNTDDFTVIKRKRFYLSKASNNPNTFPSLGPGPSAVSLHDTVKHFSIKVPLVKTLKYTDASISNPTNTYPFLCMGWGFADNNGQTVGNTTTSVWLQAQSHLYYKDA